jgi:hypothetical protein
MVYAGGTYSKGFRIMVRHRFGLKWCPQRDNNNACLSVV